MAGGGGGRAVDEISSQLVIEEVGRGKETYVFFPEAEAR